MERGNGMRLTGVAAAVAAAAGMAGEVGSPFAIPSSGQQNARGGPGTRKVQRVAAKRRNVQRNRAAHRG